MINILEREFKRVAGKLEGYDPLSDEYAKLVDRLERLNWLLKDELEVGADAIHRLKMAPAEEAKLPWEEAPAPVILPKDEEPKSILPKEEPIVIKSVDEVLSKEVVRARLQGASEKGVHIQPIIAKFVPEGKPVRFSSVPESSYNALVKELYDAQNQ